MNKLQTLKIILTISSVLLGLGNADDIFFDDDNDEFQDNNAMINVRLYKNDSDCFNYKNSLFNYHKNFNIECDCFKINSCFDTLINSNKLNDFSFKYNNYSYRLNELNFTYQCYLKNGLYIYNELNIYQYCGSRIFLFILAVIIIFSCIIANFSYMIKIREKRYRNNLVKNNQPPDYNTLN